jgi:hypothetical protein
MITFLIVDDHPLFREALGNAVRLVHPDARILESMSIQGALNILSSEQGMRPYKKPRLLLGRGVCELLRACLPQRGPASSALSQFL